MSPIRAIGPVGPIFMYTGYERLCLDALERCCPDLAAGLEALRERLFDLHPLLKQSWYHPAMRGSWSLKAVLPTIAPEMDYGQLDGVRDGTAAQLAWLETVRPDTPPARKSELREQLLRYCRHDTLAMVRIAHFLEGR
jgi:predicted RecB family nuclease